MKILLVAIAKREEKYIREWLTYNINIGFDNIVLYDNNDIGNDSMKDIVKEYDKVIYKDARGKETYQMASYKDAYFTYKDEYDWIAFFDCDEFLTFDSEDNIKTWFENRPQLSNFDKVHIFWEKCYNDNNFLYPTYDSVIESLTTEVKNNEDKGNYLNNHIKSIVNTNGRVENFISPHNIDDSKNLKCCDCEGNDSINGSIILKGKNKHKCYIRHYIYRSTYDVFNFKIRGAADGDPFRPNFIFNGYLSNNEINLEKYKFINRLLSDTDNSYPFKNNDILKEVNNKMVKEQFEKYFNTYYDINDKDKYFVCTCAKNEDLYLREWVEHYLNIGFDKIAIADNNDEDTLNDILKDYIDNGQVVLYNYKDFLCFQVEFYSLFCDKGNYKWCAYFDCDEFLEITNGSSIKEYLEGITEDCVCVNWLMYGPNGNNSDTNKPVQERFPSPIMPLSIFKDNMFIKSIVRGGEDNKFHNCKFNGSHLPYVEDNIEVKYNIGGHKVVNKTSHMSFPPIYKDLYLKHYYTKSFSEWCNKASRGWPDGTPKLSISNYFNFSSQDIPAEKNYISLFSENSGKKEGFLDDFDTIAVEGYKYNIYSLYITLSKYFHMATGKAYVITEEIDDTYFNLLFEEAMKTGNKLIYAKNQDEIWLAYLRNNKGTSYTYFILTLY